MLSCIPQYHQNANSSMNNNDNNNFPLPIDHKVEMNERNGKQILDLNWEQRKLRNAIVTVIPVEVGALGTVRKGSKGD